MAWGLSHKEAGVRAASWLVCCATCDNALPIEGAVPEKNTCRLWEGEYYTHSEHYCPHHPKTVMRRKTIERLNRKEKGK